MGLAESVAPAEGAGVGDAVSNSASPAAIETDSTVLEFCKMTGVVDVRLLNKNYALNDGETDVCIANVTIFVACLVAYR